MNKESATVKALRIIRDHQINMPSVFGRFMWPDNPNWTHSGQAGNGQAKGVGMRLASGAFLGRLKKSGLVRETNDCYKLTPEGQATLDAAEREQPR